MDVPQDRNLDGVDITLVWEVVLDHDGARRDALSAGDGHTEIRSVAA